MAALVQVSFPHPLLPQMHVGYHVGVHKIYFYVRSTHSSEKNMFLSAIVIIYTDQSLLRVLISGVKHVIW